MEKPRVHTGLTIEECFVTVQCMFTSGYLFHLNNFNMPRNIDLIRRLIRRGPLLFFNADDPSEIANHSVGQRDAQNFTS
jgi:hypothetical protein